MPTDTVVYAPVLIAEALLAGFVAAVYGLIVGQPPRRLVSTLQLAFVGVVAGQLVAEQIRTPGLMIGDLHVLEAMVGAIFLIVVARRLGRLPRKDRRRDERARSWVERQRPSPRKLIQRPAQSLARWWLLEGSLGLILNVRSECTAQTRVLNTGPECEATDRRPAGAA